MGRQVKRVALDFTWPLNEVWKGYLNPWYEFCHTCNSCGGSGYGPVARLYKAQWYGDAPFDPADMGSEPFPSDQPQVAALAQRNTMEGDDTDLMREIDRLLSMCFNNHWMHHLCQDDVDALWQAGRLRDFQEKPTAAEVNVWSLMGIGHDSINAHICIEARCKREGVAEIECPICKGTGSAWSDPDAERKADEWKPTEPPAGDGYQMWETVSEGSPISPVFKTSEELARYMACHPWGADKGTPYETWLAMINGGGWAPSLVAVHGKVYDGVSGIEVIKHAE